MTRVIGRGRYRAEFEIIGGDWFIRLPFIGELASNLVTPWCFTPWWCIPR